MYLAIDDRPLIRQPHTTEIVPQEERVAYTGDQRVQVQPGGDYIVLNATFGRNLSYEGTVRELHRLRADRGIHSVTFESMSGGRRITINAYMRSVRQAHVGYDSCGRIISSAFTVSFVQVDTPVFLYRMRFPLPGILSVADNWCYRTAPAAGTIIMVDGHIRDLGAGAGQTRIQVSNGLTDYLTTRGDFLQGGTHRLVNQVLAANPDFAGGDTISIDVDDIPAGGLSSDGVIDVWALLFRP